MRRGAIYYLRVRVPDDHCFAVLETDRDRGFDPTSIEPDFEVLDQEGMASDHIISLRHQLHDNKYEPETVGAVKRLAASQKVDLDTAARGRAGRSPLSIWRYRAWQGDLAAYIAALFEAQEGLCVITGLPLQFRGGDDHQLCCSLDRIDSNGHYAPGNLQIVCKFINMWKSNQDDAEFRRLIEVVRRSSGF